MRHDIRTHFSTESTFVASILFSSRAKMVERDINYKLTMEIEKHPLVYNFNIPEYTNKALIDKTWKIIAEKINISVADCKEKWRNIRSSFLRSKKPPPLGSRPKKPYYLAEYLEFLLPFVKPTYYSPDPDDIPILNYEEEFEQQQDLEDNELQQLQEEEEENSDLDDNFEAASHNARDQSHFFAEPTPMRHRTGRTRKRPMPDKLPIEYRKRKRDDLLQTLPASTNPMHYFFLSLLGEFDTMSESQTREFKIRVLQLIGEIKSKTAIEISPTYPTSARYSPMPSINSPGSNPRTHGPKPSASLEVYNGDDDPNIAKIKTEPE